ncbi:uncharacterized protein LOC107884411 [Acyrthosiphon pisum]|uniref:Uncharacterized protein n=1 Tax=Acyrthosiphon pisum TaxID=7029 RepID=A0A8R2HA45_ACYPI|nr:uncharacterized protein LOC107884411 [Acyrthosiphon pisum]|eukprot:XP_016661884.1 PREDICTED: uncharacterized protein LOC107884411 [Acyrthosiphon pisum]
MDKNPKPFWCLHLSAICQSVGVVEMTPLIITMSAQWFPKNERNTTATGLVLNVIVTLLVYISSRSAYTPLNTKPVDVEQSAKMFHLLKTLVAYVCSSPPLLTL